MQLYCTRDDIFHYIFAVIYKMKEIYFRKYLDREIVKRTLIMGTSLEILVSVGHIESCKYIFIACLDLLLIIFQGI